MANFIKLTKRYGKTRTSLINMDLVLQIIEMEDSFYKTRLIFNMMYEDDFAYTDVKETVKDILLRL